MTKKKKLDIDKVLQMTEENLKDSQISKMLAEETKKKKKVSYYVIMKNALKFLVKAIMMKFK